MSGHEADPFSSSQSMRIALISGGGLSRERLEFLSKLPVLLNSSLQLQKVIGVALEHLMANIGAEAATVFLINEQSKELVFWVLRGSERERLEGKRMYSANGIVGSVISSRRALRLDEVSTDERFFPQVDDQGQFKTKSLLCVPLLVKHDRCLGAIQLINKKGQNTAFSADDLNFVEQFSHQVALAVENAKLYEEAKEKSERLLKLDNTKSAMISIISHEFRTPLNIIQIAADIMSGETANPADREQMADLLIDGVQRLTKLISEMRNVALVQNQNLPIHPEPLDVVQLFNELSLKYESVLAERELRLRKQVLEPGLFVMADASLLRVVFQNLMANAIRFTPNNGCIMLRAAADLDMVELSVQDSGIGIEPEQIPLIFEKFYEVTDVINHSSGDFRFKSNGLGLGLAAVRDILQRHGSIVRVQSEPGKGSSFTFCLPRAHA